MSAEQHAITALRALVATGFRLFVLGEPSAPDALVYVRARAEMRDMIKVYGPDECEAVRMSHKKLARQIDGTTSEVVAAVLGWPDITEMPRFDR